MNRSDERLGHFGQARQRLIEHESPPACKKRKCWPDISTSLWLDAGMRRTLVRRGAAKNILDRVMYRGSGETTNGSRVRL